MRIQSFFDKATFTVTYIVIDEVTKSCAVIDPVLDFDASSGRISYGSAERVVFHVRDEGLQNLYILETHAHADHLSAASYLQSKLGGKIGIGAHIVEVQKLFSKIFNLKNELLPYGRQFDALFEEGDEFAVGFLAGKVMHTPGHTPACVTYVIADAAFVGDTLFMPDYGSARADFPGGNARELYRSMRRILALPRNTRLFTCHDYKAEGRNDFAWESTVEDAETTST
jgi:glyoxylase-like metal-dependent hydrolase (beta-lactamase superfamily II)